MKNTSKIKLAMRFCAPISMIAALALGSSSAFGEVARSYIGPTAGTFGVPGDWTPAGPVLNADDIILGNQPLAAGAYMVTDGSVATLSSIEFDGTNSFTLKGNGGAGIPVALVPGTLHGVLTLNNASSVLQTVSFGVAGGLPALVVATPETFQTAAAGLTVTSNLGLTSTLTLQGGAGQIILSGIISGATGVVQVGGATAAKVTLSGTNTFGTAGTPSVLLNAGVLTLANNAALGAGTLSVGPGIAGATRTLTSDATRTIANNIAGTADFTVTPVGTLTLNGVISGTSNITYGGAAGSATQLGGVNTYTGNSLITGTVTVASTRAFGTGAVTVNGGGTLRAINASPAGTTINVMQTYSQTNGTLQLAVYNGVNNDNDKVIATGAVTLGANSTLTLTAPNGAFTFGTNSSYLLAQGSSLTGMFATVNGLGNFTNPAGSFDTLDYTATNVSLVSRQFLALTPNLTPNERAIASNLDSSEGPAISGKFATLVNALYALPSSTIAGNLDELSPEKFGYFTSVTAFNNASFETVAMDNYLASQRGANGSFLAGNGTIDTSGLTINDSNYDPGLTMVHSRLMAFNAAPVSNGLVSDVANPMLTGVDMKDMKDSKDMKEMAPVYTDPWNFFVRGSVILAQGFSQPDIAHFDDNTESITLGTDYRITPNFLVGLTASYSHTDVTLDDNGSSATVDSYSPGLYASYADKGWYANVSGNYLHNAYTESRAISFIGQTANGAPEGNEGVANLDGGYDFHQGGLTFGPLAGIQYTHLSVDGFGETGSIADLTVKDQESDSLRSRLGGHLSYAFSNHGLSFIPHIGATWQHEFMDQSRGITSQFGFGGGSFAVNTPNPSRDSALADAGFDVDITHTVSIFVDYIAQAGQDNYFGQSVQGGVKIGF